MKLFYRELGEGPAIIILHGVFGSSDNWLTPAKLLAGKNKVFMVDLRNHGQSPKSDDFNNAVMAEDLKEFIDDHQINNPLVIGHSMGGKVAMTFASRYPDLLSKLVVVDIAPKYYPPHHQKILDGLNSIDLKNLKTRQEADDQMAKFEPALGVRQFLLKNIYRNEENEFSWRINLPVITKNIENVGEALNESVIITVPTLFIRGGNSRYIKENDHDLIAKIFSNAKIETIEGTGHWVQAEKPKEFVELVRGFIEN